MLGAPGIDAELELELLELDDRELELDEDEDELLDDDEEGLEVDGIEGCCTATCELLEQP